MSSSLIAVAQIEVLYYPPKYKEPNENEIRNIMFDEHWSYEYIPKDKPDSICWNITDCVDDWYPESFMEIIDGDWGDSGDMIYEETVKRISTHPDLEIVEGLINPRHTKTYKLADEHERALFIRFPVILRAYFDYDSYNNEMDCSYWIEGVPDLSHLEDLLNVSSED